MSITIKEIKVRFSRKVHPIKYNPVEVEMEATADVTHAEEQKARRAIYKRLKADVDEACERIIREESPNGKDAQA